MTDISSITGSGQVTNSVNAQLDILSAQTNPAQGETDRQSLAEDFDEFLLLLTTQLENQDPTEPLDTNEFTNQLVMFVQAEQAVNTNTNLEELISLQQDSSMSTAVSYIGKDVDAKGNAGQLDNSGYAQFTYELDAPANTATVVISDGAGRAVYSGQGPTDSGKNSVLWDGINSFTGNVEPTGTYFINVVASNASGDKIESRTYTSGRVTSAQLVGDEMVLEVAGTNVKFTDVQAIREPEYITVDEPVVDQGETGEEDDEEDA